MRRLGALLALALLLTGCGGSDDDVAPVHRYTAYDRLWSSTTIAGADVRDPSDVAVGRGLTVLAAHRSAGGDGQLVGVDTGTGTERWRLSVDAPLPGSSAHLYDTSSFALAGHSVIVPVWDGNRAGVAAVSADHGLVQWTSLRPDRYSEPTVVGSAGGTVVWGRRAYTTSVEDTIAVSAETGDDRWSRPGLQPLAVSGASVVAQQPNPEAGQPGRPVVLDVATGSRRWQMARNSVVEAVSGGWLFAENLAGDRGSGAYALADGRYVSSGQGRVGLENDEDRVVPMGDGQVWPGAVTDTQRYVVLRDGARRPAHLDVGYDAGSTPYTVAGPLVLAAEKGQAADTVAYDAGGHPVGAPIPGWLVGVYGPQGRYLVTVSGHDPGAPIRVYQRHR